MKQDPRKKIRVLIADDHQVVREGLSAVLNAQKDIEVIAEAKDGLEAIEKSKALGPDVILMDISMPRMNGVEATRRIKIQRPEIGIVVLTMFDDEVYIVEMFKAGATSYMLKHSDSEQIIRAIRSCHQKEPVISDPVVAGKLLNRIRQAPPVLGKKSRPAHELTEREIEIIRLLSKANKEIAQVLNISEKTVKNHVRNIFQKLGVENRTEAVLHAVRRGLIQTGIKQ